MLLYLPALYVVPIFCLQCAWSTLVFLFGLFFLTTLRCESQSFRIVTSCYAKQSLKSWTLDFTLKG